MSRKNAVLWIAAAIAALAIAGVVLVRLHNWTPRLTTVQGAVIRQNVAPGKEVPIDGALVTATRDMVSASTRSDASGYFKITFPQVIWPGQTVNLAFRDPDYHPLDMDLKMEFRSTARRIILAAMKPVAPEIVTPSGKLAAVVSNIRIRYTVNSESAQNIGSVVKTFQVVNQGNVPCRGQEPCSPDGNWKAANGTVTLDAGFGDIFRDVRASCIAGPCPFTRVDIHGFNRGGRTVVATAEDWSDTATFLVEAEVFRTTIASDVRESYPVLFDSTLNFSVPANQEGVSIEAEIGGTPMVFPLGGDYYLTWATCTERINQAGDKSAIYQCSLKPGYKF